MIYYIVGLAICLAVVVISTAMLYRQEPENGERQALTKSSVPQLGYVVFDTEGHKLTDCFVLHPEIDAAARTALLTYSYLTPNKQLAKEIRRWLDRIESKS